MKYRYRVSKYLHGNTVPAVGRFVPATMTESLRVNSDIYKTQAVITTSSQSAQTDNPTEYSDGDSQVSGMTERGDF